MGVKQKKKHPKEIKAEAVNLVIKGGPCDGRYQELGYQLWDALAVEEATDRSTW